MGNENEVVLIRQAFGEVTYAAPREQVIYSEASVQSPPFSERLSDDDAFSARRFADVLEVGEHRLISSGIPFGFWAVRNHRGG